MVRAPNLLKASLKSAKSWLTSERRIGELEEVAVCVGFTGAWQEEKRAGTCRLVLLFGRPLNLQP